MSDAPRGGRQRAWLELLRAPLLFSPAADVLAGWCVASGHAWAVQSGFGEARPHPVATIQLAGLPALLLAALTATCLLAAGMAQNALVDRRDDALRKPGRPIPSGRIAPTAVTGAWLGLSAAGLLLADAGGLLPLALAIVAGTAAYHYALKPLRVPGCLMLGALRGLSMALGARAFEQGPFLSPGSDDAALMVRQATGVVLVFAVPYALYMAAASLHASTDDAPQPSSWSHAGLSGCLLASAWITAATLRSSPGSPATAEAATAALIGLFALLRLGLAWRRLPPGPLTGVALSGLFVLHALVCVGRGPPGFAWIAAASVALLFAASRALKHSFPPT